MSLRQVSVVRLRPTYEEIVVFTRYQRLPPLLVLLRRSKSLPDLNPHSIVRTKHYLTQYNIIFAMIHSKFSCTHDH